jgi:hypothetical protein
MENKTTKQQNPDSLLIHYLTLRKSVGLLGIFLPDYKPIFWLEALAFEAFGFSWLTKGEALLPDKNK